MAEFFVYDFVYRNRTRFGRNHSGNRRSFGYRFENGRPIVPASSYAEFKTAIATGRKQFRYSLKFDIASYFNSLYHHDITRWFSKLGGTDSDYEALGQFLREINSGRSVDCLPHGLHPCKIIGAEFLKSVDNSVKIRSELLLRFMDDFYLFSDSEEVIIDDFLSIQKLLGEKGLSVNPEKTVLGNADEFDLPKHIDDMKRGLLRIRRKLIDVSGEPVEIDSEVVFANLNEEQVDYLLSLLKNPNIDESDAELVLSLLRDHGNDVLSRIPDLLAQFPSLSRNIYAFARFVDDKNTMGDLLFSFLQNVQNVTEEQLFWIAKIAEDFLSKESRYRDLLIALYDHPNASVISRAKVLEIPESRFGMGELREEHLRTGQSDWLAWASAVGTRREPANSRNHVISYFSKGSPTNKLVSDCVRSLA